MYGTPAIWHHWLRKHRKTKDRKRAWTQSIHALSFTPNVFSSVQPPGRHSPLPFTDSRFVYYRLQFYHPIHRSEFHLYAAYLLAGHTQSFHHRLPSQSNLVSHCRYPVHMFAHFYLPATVDNHSNQSPQYPSCESLQKIVHHPHSAPVLYFQTMYATSSLMQHEHQYLHTATRKVRYLR